MSEQDISTSRVLPSVSIPREIAKFVVAGLVVLATVGTVLALAQERMATAEAIRDARTLTNLYVTDVVGPLLTPAALVPGPAQAALDKQVRARVLGSYIVRVKIWDDTGRIVYSDDTRLIGMQFPLPVEEQQALEQETSSAEVSDLSSAENSDERQFGKLLQVYQGVQLPGGQRVLFETYQPFEVISVASRRMWLTSLPILLTGLILLYVVQVPLAYRMARRLKDSQDEREGLLVATLAASDRERAVIAADLHDGVVQGLTGASYTLTAAADRARESDPTAAGVMSTSATDLRRWVRELRSLVVTITPPALHASGLAAALADLAATLELRGMTVTVDVTGTEDLDSTTERVLYRAAQEAVRNVVRHAKASAVTLTTTREGDVVELCVRDDGRGFTAATTDARRRGSVGLELLQTVVTAQGGTLTVDSVPEEGTTVRLQMPVAARPAVDA
ncbi:MAG: integral rane sensor signal transduction histidine kinase [Frankiales bacterium]|nr:integral rane sensor signal transduction histidine kinase [Frankiales bacterium]